MSRQDQIKRKVRSLTPGDTIHIDTNTDIQNRKLHIKRVEKAETHAKDGNQHYRVYAEGTGNQKGVGTYVINLGEVDWPHRRSNHPSPELFYIKDDNSRPGEDEEAEGGIIQIR